MSNIANSVFIIDKHIEFGAISKLYSLWESKDRYFHNKKHLDEVIEGVAKWKYRLKSDEFEQLILASFFHDAIYDPKNPKDNEEKSIEFFKKSLKDKSASYPLVERAIRCTASRKRPGEFPLRVFWDADNSIFLKSWHEYIIWEDSIRAEYSHLSDDKYREKRNIFLKENLGIFGARADMNIRKLIEKNNRSNEKTSRRII